MSTPPSQFSAGHLPSRSGDASTSPQPPDPGGPRLDHPTVPPSTRRAAARGAHFRAPPFGSVLQTWLASATRPMFARVDPDLQWMVSLLGPDSTRAPLPRQPATARTPARASLPLTTALLRARPLPTHHAPRSAPTQISSVTPHPEHGPDPNLLQDSASTFIPRTHASPRSAFGSGPRAQPTRHGPNSDSAPQAAPLPLTTWSRPHKRPPL